MKLGRQLSDADIIPFPWACKYEKGNYNFEKTISNSKCKDNNYSLFPCLHTVWITELLQKIVVKDWDKNQ